MIKDFKPDVAVSARVLIALKEYLVSRGIGVNWDLDEDSITEKR